MIDTPAAQYDRAETEKLLNSPTAKPRKYWVTEVQWAANHIALPLCKRHDLPFMFPVLVFPLSAAAHEERVEAVAKVLFYHFRTTCVISLSWREMHTTSRELWRVHARAILAALHPKM